MEKFIPYEKLSKKKKRELDALRRTLWAISPETRRSENPKAYNRKKAQKRMDDPGSVLSLFYKTVVSRLCQGEGKAGRKMNICKIISGPSPTRFRSVLTPHFTPD